MTEYTLNIMGMQIKGQTVWIYALLPVLACVAYIACAISLYAFDTLLGIPEFSWTNAFWWMIVIATCMAVFNGGD